MSYPARAEGLVNRIPSPVAYCVASSLRANTTEGTEEEIQKLLEKIHWPHWPLSMVLASWEPWCLVSHHQPCCLLLLNKTCKAAIKNKKRRQKNCNTLSSIPDPNFNWGRFDRACLPQIDFISNERIYSRRGSVLSWCSFHAAKTLCWWFFKKDKTLIQLRYRICWLRHGQVTIIHSADKKQSLFSHNISSHLVYKKKLLGRLNFLQG